MSKGTRSKAVAARATRGGLSVGVGVGEGVGVGGGGGASKNKRTAPSEDNDPSERQRTWPITARPIRPIVDSFSPAILSAFPGGVGEGELSLFFKQFRCRFGQRETRAGTERFVRHVCL